jgi:tripartite-type tricarboxylate transporter receptor subunit TctC
MTRGRTLLRAMGLAVGVAGSLTCLGALPAEAQQYPAQDIHFICAWPAGSGADTIVRFYAEKMRPLAGKPIIVENKPGAGGNIGVEHASKAKPDGYTVLVNGGYTIASNMHLYKRPPIPSVNAFQMFATINQQAFVLTVDAKSPYHKLSDLTAALKEKGEKASYGVGAPAGVVAAYIYKEKENLKAVEVNYRTSADSFNDMLGGNVEFAMMEPIFATARLRQGQLRILAVTSPRRLQANSELPTFAELGYPEIAMNLWWAGAVPAGTPQPIVEQLNKWFNQITSSEEGKKFLNGFSADPFVSNPAEAQKLLNEDDKAWAEYVKRAKIVPQG